MPISLFDAIPGQDIHWITFIGLIVALVGFFYVSYEVLDRPHSLLREILLFALLVLIPLVVIPLPILLFTFFFWWNISVRQVGLGIALIFAVSSGMVGGFYGIFATFHELYPDSPSFQSRTKKLSRRNAIRRRLHALRNIGHFFSRVRLLFRWDTIKRLPQALRNSKFGSPSREGMLKGSLFGFVWIIGYWLLIFVLFLQVSLSLAFLPIVLLFGPFSIIAGGIWLGYIYKPKSAPSIQSGLVDQNGQPITSIGGLTRQATIVDQYGNPLLQKKKARTWIGRLLHRSDQHITQKIGTSNMVYSPSRTARPPVFNRKDARRGCFFWLLVPLGVLSVCLPPAVILGDLIFQTPIDSFVSGVLLPSLLIASGVGVVSTVSGWLHWWYFSVCLLVDTSLSPENVRVSRYYPYHTRSSTGIDRTCLCCVQHFTCLSN